ncbi:MAG: segregation/condensation protein A [Bacteroidota bacterium]
MSQNSYRISLPQFQGPFDLLLFFIERDELDIHDIPIAQITDEFLGYIREMEQMNIDLASEFVLVAATLCRIKAKMLIPRKPLDDEGNEIDPREELVQRLLEYKRYKSVLEELREMEDLRALKNKRGNAINELQTIANKAMVDSELESFNLFKLLRTFERMLNRYEERQKKPTVHTVMRYRYTIADQQSYIYEQIDRKKKASFEDLFANLENRVHAIVTFLALLEMANQQFIKITLGIGANNFWLSRPQPGDEEEE